MDDEDMDYDSDEDGYMDEDEFSKDDESANFICDMCGDPITDQDVVPVGIEIYGFTVDEYEESKELEKRILCCIDCFKMRADAILKKLENEDEYESV